MYRFLGLLSNLVLASAVRVIVTGAGGKTGRLIFSQLKSDFEGVVQPVGLVRSKKFGQRKQPKRFVKPTVVSLHKMSL